METIRLTMAQAVVKWLTNQYTEIDGEQVPVFAGAFGIFGHGNVTCLAEALEPAQDELPLWRGHNEQSMALAAVAYAKANARTTDHDRDVIDRPRLHQHGDCRRCRPCQPHSAAPAVGRHVPTRIVDPVLSKSRSSMTRPQR